MRNWPVALLLLIAPGLAFAQAGGTPAPVSLMASGEVHDVLEWISKSRDNGRMPYLVVDKVNARVFAFDAYGNFLGEEPALVGMARGDDSASGIGSKALAAIGPGDRTTPAGRFVSSLTRDLQGKEVLMIDYGASITLHPVAKGTPAERRAERLASPTAGDNRISFGCINVSAMFYKRVVSPAFTGSNGVVYILPETRKPSEVFPAMLK